MTTKNHLKQLFSGLEKKEKTTNLYNEISLSLINKKYQFKYIENRGGFQKTELIVELSEDKSIAFERLSEKIGYNSFFNQYECIGYDNLSKKVIDLKPYLDFFITELLNKFIDDQVKDLFKEK